MRRLFILRLNEFAKECKLIRSVLQNLSIFAPSTRGKSAKIQYILLIFISFSVALQAQDAKVSGTVFDSESGKAVSGASVQIGSKQANTDNDGYFEFTGILTGKVSLIITVDNYDTQTNTVAISAPETKLGTFGMKVKNFYSSEVNAGLPDVSISSMDFEDESKGQNVSGLLHSSADVFVNTAGYTLGAAYFRIRGYESDDAMVYMNGISVNDPENGRPSWSEWGGLNDAMRNKEAVNGLAPARFGFGSIGGATNLVTRASLYRKQNKLSYSLSNKSYMNRVMYTYSTGLMKNNWAFTLSGSRRWKATDMSGTPYDKFLSAISVRNILSMEDYVEGTFYDAWSYFLSAEKKLNDKHNIAITAFGSPTIRGMQAAATQECYDLTGTHYYNPNWGYQDGEKRNAKVKDFHEPMIIFNHYWNVNTKIKLTNSLAYSFGKNGTSALNWYGASDPRPDYYRNLPSYQSADPTVQADPDVVAAITEAWRTDVNTSQVNWDKLYQINALSNLTGGRTNYIIEDRRNDHSQLTLSTLMNYQKNEHILYSAGLELSKYTGYHFKIMKDLLGGNNWVDIDQFAERDFKGDTTKLQNDMDNPNKVINEGDKFGYDYNTYVNSGLLWGQAELSYNKLELFAAANISSSQFWRKGNMKNGRDTVGSFGNSAKNNYLNYAAKAGATYKITGHHYIVGNLGYFTRAPYVKDAYLFPSITSELVPNLTSEKILSGDISYVYKSSMINVRLTAYQTMFYDGIKIISYYADDLATFVNLSMTGIDKINQGFELGAEIKATSTISFIAVGALGNFRYISRPVGIITIENDFIPGTPQTIYQKNFYVSGTPQNAASFGIKYAHPKQWYLNANLNYFDKMYLDFNPERRTSDAFTGLYPNDPQIVAFTKQEKLKSGFTLDASLGKSIYYKKYFLNINFSVTNILNNQDLITNGYENMRFVLTEPNKFQAKYFYGLGRTFFLNLQVRI